MEPIIICTFDKMLKGRIIAKKKKPSLKELSDKEKSKALLYEQQFENSNSQSLCGVNWAPIIFSI